MKKKVLLTWIICCLTACGGGGTGSVGSPDTTSTNQPPNNTNNNADTSLVNDNQKPTAKLSINEDAPTANSNRVRLHIEAEDNDRVVAYFTSLQNQTPDMNSTGWTSVRGVSSINLTLNNFSLSSGGGNKKVFLWVKDAAGNISEPASAEIDVWGFRDLSEFCGDPADVDLAVDSQNKVHIVCKNGNGIYYLTNRSGNWTSETLSNAGIYVTSPSIAIDSHDVIHVVFNSWFLYLGTVPVGLIVYDRKIPGAGWDETVVTGPLYSVFVGNTSLVRDRNDKLHLATFLKMLQPNTKTLWYLNNVSGTWQIDSSVEPSSFPNDNPQVDLTVDNVGPRICYSQGGELIYAKKVGNIWNRLSNGLTDGINCSIVSDSVNANWIAYHDIHNALDIISFDVGVGNSSDTFLTIHNESDITVGKYISLSAGNNKLYVAFFDALNNVLYYAAQGQEDQDWFTLLIDSAGIQDNFPLKLAVDSQEKLHLVYYKMPGAKLMYATTR